MFPTPIAKTAPWVQRTYKWLLPVALIVWLSGFTYRWVEKPGQRVAARLAARLFPGSAATGARPQPETI